MDTNDTCLVSLFCFVLQLVDVNSGGVVKTFLGVRCGCAASTLILLYLQH